ncbi:MAG: hypothetical protein ACYDER_01240 [Ktedonobacteraceae bacterium]
MEAENPKPQPENNKVPEEEPTNEDETLESTTETFEPEDEYNFLGADATSIIRPDPTLELIPTREILDRLPEGEELTLEQLLQALSRRSAKKRNTRKLQSEQPNLESDEEQPKN